MSKLISRRRFIGATAATAGMSAIIPGIVAMQIGQETTTIKINAQTKLGAVKPVNGICNGPLSYGGAVNLSPYFAQANFPYCRLHDTNWPNAREVDIHTIFRNFDADADDPANYDFYWTDEYINSIEAVGAKVIYRLGTSIEHTKKKIYTHPPADFNKWAKICLNIARHYNEGWANGYHKNIMYWEVWNEPDAQTPNRSDDTMWSGTPQQFYELYGATARLFKKEMPYVKIGGYASSLAGVNNKGRDFFFGFLNYVRENNLSFHFFSWHGYGSTLPDFHRRAAFIREQLDLHGFTETEMIMDEWNYYASFGVFTEWDNHRGLTEWFAEAYGMIGASFTAALLIEMTTMPIDIATFYEGQAISWWSPFNMFGLPHKQFYPFVAFNQTANGAQRVFTECAVPNIYVLAAALNNELRIMLCNYKGETGAYPLEITGLDPKARYTCTLHVLDEQHDFEKVEEQTGLAYADIPRSIHLNTNTVAMMTLATL